MVDREKLVFGLSGCYNSRFRFDFICRVHLRDSSLIVGLAGNQYLDALNTMASVQDEILERKQFASFGKFDEFSKLQTTFLGVDLAREPTDDEEGEEGQRFTKLSLIVNNNCPPHIYSLLTVIVKLDEYQEQSYLLDPFLEQLVAPVVECLKNHVIVSQSATQMGSVPRIGRLSALLYQYIKCRGYKTISRSLFLHVAPR